jgi:hypothetical protein
MEKVVASERSKTLLLQEVAHRTKNNLAMLSAMVRLQSRNLGQGASDALDKTSQRIQTMAEVYDHLMLRDQTKPDTLMQDRICRNDENLLHRTAGPYHTLGHEPLSRPGSVTARSQIPAYLNAGSKQTLHA